jgi:DNA topoisomerase-2
LRTPLIALKDSKDNIKHFFFTLDEYNLFLASNDISKYKLQYYKGLGSWEPKDLKPLVEKFGIEYFLETFILDDEGNITIDNWLNGKNADKRKEYLNDIEFNLFNI